MNLTEQANLDYVADIFKDIAAVRGKQKEEIIKKHRSNQLVLDYLDYLLNPFKTYGFSEARLHKSVSMPPNYEYNSLTELLNDLANRKGIDDQTIANVQEFLNMLWVDLREFAGKIITKSLRLGVTAKTVNKALGYQFIPTFECMLAEKYYDHPDYIIGKSFAITEKLDGIRCCAVITDDNIALFTRQGQPIEGLIDVESDLRILRESYGIDFVLDGELLISDRENIPSSEQYKATTQIVRREGIKHGITYNVFDMISTEAFMTETCTTPYYLRKQLLDTVVRDVEHVKTLPWLYHGSDPEMVYKVLNEQLSLFHEGVMINILDAPYEFKRTKNLLKVKVMNEVDLEIKHVLSGAGRLSDTMGSLLVDYKGSVLGVGTGFDDATRSWMWEHRAELPGRVVTIRYFEETHDADGNLSLRFPVFVELREEGKEVSYS